ncbi:MAG: MFS transporter, partial [Actinobacteria bacterium]|nr:MFS transporter [Actinomycetota bacterium]
MRKPTPLYLVSFAISGFALTMVGPALSTLRERTGSSIAEIGSLFLALQLGFIVGSVFAGRMLDRYPSLATDMPRNGDGSGAGTQRCKTDLSQILAAVVKDLKFGGNRYTVEAAKFYLGQNDEIQHVRLQLYASLYAHEQLGEMAKLAITGDLEASAEYTDA